MFSHFINFSPISLCVGAKNIYKSAMIMNASSLHSSWSLLCVCEKWSLRVEKMGLLIFTTSLFCLLLHSLKHYVHRLYELSILSQKSLLLLPLLLHAMHTSVCPILKLFLTFFSSMASELSCCAHFSHSIYKMRGL